MRVQGLACALTVDSTSERSKSGVFTVTLTSEGGYCEPHEVELRVSPYG